MCQYLSNALWKLKHKIIYIIFSNILKCTKNGNTNPILWRGVFANTDTSITSEMTSTSFSRNLFRSCSTLRCCSLYSDSWFLKQLFRMFYVQVPRNNFCKISFILFLMNLYMKIMYRIYCVQNTECFRIL